MKWLKKCLSRKTDDDLLLSYIKTQYNFDKAIIIKRDAKDFPIFVQLVATAIFQKNNSDYGIEPAELNKLINQINTNFDFFIVKMSRDYMTTTSHDYALFFKSPNGYSVPFKYLSDNRLFGTLPELVDYDNDSFRYIKKMKSYQCLIVNNNIKFIPSYSFRFPLKKNSLMESESAMTYNFHNIKDACTRDLEVVIEIKTIDNSMQYSVKLFYGHILLKQEDLKKLLDLKLFLNDFLFPYNMTEDEASALGLTLPLHFTPAFMTSLNPDLKTTLDMLKI